MAWCRKASRVAEGAGYEAALVMARPADITNAIIAALIYARYELPAFSTLERLTKHVQSQAHRQTFQSVFRRLSARERKALDRVPVIAVDQRRTALQKIKQLPQRPSRKHLEESVRHLEWLETLGGEGTALESVTPTLVGEFAKQARTADAGEFQDFTGPKRYTLLLSLIHNARTRTRDAVATTLVNRVATFHKRAKEELEQRQFDQRQRVEGLLGKFGEVIHIVATVRSDRRVGQQVRSMLTQTQEIGVLQQECATAQNWTGSNYLPLLWRHFKNSRLVLFRAVNALKLRSATQDDALLKAWGVLSEKRNQRTEYLPLKEVPLSFASRRWWDLLRHPTDPQKIDRRQLGICVLSSWPTIYKPAQCMRRGRMSTPIIGRSFCPGRSARAG